ncbi:MAG: HD domain-containing protein [Xanthomonadaceae bacterium]|nr:HD domain-containing protein [Xanthomonadaceae bacterium]
MIYDVLYGFIPITQWEEEIINSPFFQRLRWIKQLGFANYVFPGAEHNRFAHAIGVMHSMDQMLRSLDLAVSDDELFDPNKKSKDTMIHKCLRIAALLHDIGTFPFSHAIEYAYIRHGRDKRRDGGSLKDLPNSHEHLGSFIIKNTPYEGGITHILKKYGLDVQLISQIIKGESPYLYANQLMHSDLDADRMDYLIRDAHYTGIRYGQFDRDFLLSNLRTYTTKKKQIGFGVKESAIHAIEDFLIARFWWYSQVIKNPQSAKFDIMSSHVAESFLGQDWLYQFQDLLTMIETGDERFFWWNDVYFMTRLQDVWLEKKITDPKIREWVEMLLYRKAPKRVRVKLFEHQLLNHKHREDNRGAIVIQIKKHLMKFDRALKKSGKGSEWILVDIPGKDVRFTQSREKIKGGISDRDAIKIVRKNGEATLLIDYEHSLVRHLSDFANFVPSVYANDSALKILQKKGLAE